MKELITETTKDFNPAGKAITYSVLVFIAVCAFGLIVKLASAVVSGDFVNFQY